MTTSGRPKVVILAGGMGTRLQEETAIRPKPMVEIGGWPILWHIMKIYGARGFNEFVVALGYKGDWIKDYFLNYNNRKSNITLELKSGRATIHQADFEDWTVHLVDTGLHTQTGGRLKRLEKWIGDSTFMMTYGDGVAGIDVEHQLAFHKKHGRAATITSVRPPARFGGLEFEGDLVRRFTEKPQAGEGWINGGFLVLEPSVLDRIDGDDTIFERAPLERLAAEQQLVSYRHEGFWQCMDTLRDVRLLESLWNDGAAPWRVW